MCVTDRHDMTLTVKVALNPNAINQSIKSRLYQGVYHFEIWLVTLSKTMRSSCKLFSDGNNSHIERSPETGFQRPS